MQKLVSMLLLLVAAGLVAVTMMTGCGMKKAQQRVIQPPIVTQAEADQVKQGMSYEEVCKIVGNPGKELEGQTAAGAPPVKHYVWANDDRSSLVADFVNNKLVNKLFNPAPPDPK